MKIKNFIFSLLVLITTIGIGFSKADYITYELYDEPEYVEEIIYEPLYAPCEYEVCDEEEIILEEVPYRPYRSYRSKRPAIIETHYYDDSSVGSNIVSGIFGFAFGSMFGALVND